MDHIFYLIAIFFVQFFCFIHCENVNAKHENEEQDAISLRVISTNFTKTVKVSRNFINFLEQDLPTVVSEIKGSNCRLRCEDNLYYIRKMQDEYQTRSLYELFYFFSVTRDCFCYDSGFFDGGSEGGGINFEWDVILEFKKKNAPLDTAINVNVSQSTNAHVNSHAEASVSANSNVAVNVATNNAKKPSKSRQYDEYQQNNYNNGQNYYNQQNNYNNNSRCNWENLIYWLVTLITRGIYDLRRIDLEEVCTNVVCRYNYN